MSDEPTTPTAAQYLDTPNTNANATTTQRGASAAGAPASSTYQNTTNKQHLKELGVLAAWSVTSAKPGNGVELLRDGSTDTYWQ